MFSDCVAVGIRWGLAGNAAGVLGLGDSRRGLSVRGAATCVYRGIGQLVCEPAGGVQVGGGGR